MVQESANWANGILEMSMATHSEHYLFSFLLIQPTIFRSIPLRKSFAFAFSPSTTRFEIVNKLSKPTSSLSEIRKFLQILYHFVCAVPCRRSRALHVPSKEIHSAVESETSRSRLRLPESFEFRRNSRR